MTKITIKNKQYALTLVNEILTTDETITNIKPINNSYTTPMIM